MSTPLRRHIVRGAAAAVLAALLLSTAGGFRRYMSHRRESRRLHLKVEETEAAVTRKRSYLALAQKNDDLLEGEARRQLGLVGEDELEFRFVPEEESAGERMEASAPSAS